MRADAGTHGPLLLWEADALLGRYLRETTQTSVLAVSGGPDSMALMQLSARLRAIGRLAPVVVATVDHRLRSGSDTEARQVASWAAELSLPHRILTWTGERPRSAVQARAREARYRLLAELAGAVGASRILTAHTLDDQAETVMLRLCAGSGLSGLTAMSETTDWGGVTVVRPFLSVAKHRLVATCEAESWAFVDDPSNNDPRFGRVRLRRLMPLLAEEGLNSRRLARLADRLRRADDALANAAAAAFARHLLREGPEQFTLDGAALQSEPAEIVMRVLELGIARVAVPTRRIRLERLERLTRDFCQTMVQHGETMKANLGGALIDLRQDGRLIIGPEPSRRPDIRKC